LDSFFTKAKELLNSLNSITISLQEQKDKFFEETGFYEVPGAKLKHVFSGMFLALGSMAKGNIKALKIEWLSKAPFIRIDLKALTEEGKLLF